VKKLLLTGFEKFLDFSSNPSEEIVLAFNQKKVGPFLCHSIILPVDFEKSPQILLQALESDEFDAVLSLGLAFSRDFLSLEKIAINLIDDVERKDNRGKIIEDQKILEKGENAYFSTLPLKRIQKGLNDEGFKSEISLSAGSFVCNLVMYRLLHSLNEKQVPAGFIHLPPDKKLKNDSNWSMSRLRDGLNIIIENLD
jgi:pyroglutamyl-peptidase